MLLILGFVGRANVFETHACSAVVGRIDHDQDASGLSNGRAVRVFELAVGRDHGKSVGEARRNLRIDEALELRVGDRRTVCSRQPKKEFRPIEAFTGQRLPATLFLALACGVYREALRHERPEGTRQQEHKRNEISRMHIQSLGLIVDQGSFYATVVRSDSGTAQYSGPLRLEPLQYGKHYWAATDRSLTHEAFAGPGRNQSTVLRALTCGSELPLARMDEAWRRTEPARADQAPG